MFEIRSDYLEDESSDEEKETREGSGFQAELPPQRPTPSGGRAGGPPPDEARWLTGRVLGPRQLAARRQAPPAGPDFATLPIEERCGHRKKNILRKVVLGSWPCGGRRRRLAPTLRRFPSRRGAAAWRQIVLLLPALALQTP